MVHRDHARAILAHPNRDAPSNDEITAGNEQHHLFGEIAEIVAVGLVFVVDWNDKSMPRP